MKVCKSWALAMVLSANCAQWALAPAPELLSRQRLLSSPEPVWKAAAPEVKFVTVPRSMLPAACETARAPEPLTTPDPLIDNPTVDVAKLSVSFIIGTDGLVHSAFVLNSIGDPQDRAALNAVNSWRYRPALCNGIPTEIEGRIEFSSRERIFGLE